MTIRETREAAIAAAAYATLAEKGFGSTTMLAIAKRAKASNETLYRWYGDKVGLFRALISANADEVRALLEADLAEGRDPLETLRALGPKLLTLLTGDRAVLLNRAAAADATGVLGQALAEAGRETVLPLVASMMDRARAAGLIACDSGAEAAALWLDLLVGDMQIRRVIGALPPPDAAEVDARADRALGHFLRLLAPG